MKRVRTSALLLRSTAYGESDSIVTFLGQTSGKISAIARGARKSSKRFGGALEPLHTLHVEFEDRAKDLVTLKEASVERARIGLSTRLDGMEAAGLALRWARALCPAKTPEPDAYDALVRMLDAVDEGASARSELAVCGLRLLVATGFGLELDQCVRCGRPCPVDRVAAVDAARGGLVCQSCGGARLLFHAPVRAKAREALRGASVVFTEPEAEEIVTLVEVALSAHAEIET